MGIKHQIMDNANRVAMNSELKKVMQIELEKAKSFYQQKDYSLSFKHLERYHILSQPFYRQHLNSHWWMFKVGIRRLDAREILGQIIRMIGSAGSLIGKYPLGNTGGANVSAFKPMPIPEDLKPYIQQD